jgi:hypothetical protein
MIQEIDFAALNVSIPESTKIYTIEQQKEIYQYLSEMDDHEKKAYEIAVHHLGTSFNIYRSNGFISWKKSKQ